MCHAVSCNYKNLLLKAKNQTQKEDVHSYGPPALRAGKIYVYRRVLIFISLCQIIVYSFLNL
jgi:hypothetical protein